MFGLFKKKNSGVDEKFTSDLLDVASDFHHVIDAIDPEFAQELISRSLNNYKERSRNEASFTASDFYFDAFTGAIFELTLESRMIPDDSVAIFSMMDSFLRGNPKYETPVVTGLMSKWQNILLELGAIQPHL